MNQVYFSSLDKLRGQIQRQSLKWGPCHREDFWKENITRFHDKKNLDLITDLINIIKSKSKHITDTTKAVACYDLGEFARFYPKGKKYLDQENTRAEMTKIMQSDKASAELKKEAIMCYQRILMENNLPASDQIITK